ncbi:MAG: purine-nucleoside phosphorylase [Elusimicrobia bacterium]|nr:purine-nucleoside phosphorylase [Elusimicrobiota bacterium]
MTNEHVETIRRAVERIRSQAPGAPPDTAVILGSGLAGAIPELSAAVSIPYADIPGFPRATVAGHAGKLVAGRLKSARVAFMQGRFHYYEGHSMESIALPIRVLGSWGVKTLIVTAAVGSMRPAIKPGHFTVISDHINLMGHNPLRGGHSQSFGQMFPDLSLAYDSKLRSMARRALKARKFRVHQGVYLAVGGPSYETPAEIGAFRTLGGDVVGMSVVPEVIVARQMGLRVLALTWTSNMASGMGAAALSHAEVLALGERVSVRLKAALGDILGQV